MWGAGGLTCKEGRQEEAAGQEQVSRSGGEHAVGRFSVRDRAGQPCHGPPPHPLPPTCDPPSLQITCVAKISAPTAPELEGAACVPLHTGSSELEDHVVWAGLRG